MDTRDGEALIREKYSGNREAAGLAADLERLTQGEPLAYVIGNIPFLGLTIGLDSRPLIPRPETEWWAEELVARIADASLQVLDLCAGSGAIGLAVLKHCPNAYVSLGELSPEHCATIKANIERNGLDAARADVRSGDLFAPFAAETFDLIAANPPYVPSGRSLEESVAAYEPAEALYAGAEGMGLIRRISTEAPEHLSAGGELWMECDTSNIQAARALFTDAAIRTDPYGRERIVVAHF